MQESKENVQRVQVNNMNMWPTNLGYSTFAPFVQEMRLGCSTL